MSSVSSNPTEYSVLARAVLTKNLKVRPGERVIIEGWTHTLPWANAFAREARRLKAEPMLLYQDEESVLGFGRPRRGKEPRPGGGPRVGRPRQDRRVRPHVERRGPDPVCRAPGEDPGPALRVQQCMVPGGQEGRPAGRPSRGRTTVPEPFRGLRGGRGGLAEADRRRYARRPEGARRPGEADIREAPPGEAPEDLRRPRDRSHARPAPPRTAHPRGGHRPRREPPSVRIDDDAPFGDRQRSARRNRCGGNHRRQPDLLLRRRQGDRCRLPVQQGPLGRPLVRARGRTVRDAVQDRDEGAGPAAGSASD